jgi:hypothetical protein
MTEFTGNPLLVVIVTISIAWGVWEWYKTDRRTPEQIMLARPREEAEAKARARIREITEKLHAGSAKQKADGKGRLEEQIAQTTAKRLAHRAKQKAEGAKQKADRKGRR